MSRAGEWQVAVPSYRRADRLHTHTLRSLADGGVLKNRVRVFVHDDAPDYRRTLDPGLYEEVVTGAGPGIAAARNAVSAFYPKGEHVVQVDDDIKGWVALGDTKVHPLDDVAGLFTRSFEMLAAQGLSLWGISPTSNHFFMRPTTTTDLRFVIGQCYGVVNDPGEVLTAPSKEDYELTLLRFDRDGGVLRHNWVGVRCAPFYTTAGGCSASSDRIAADRDAAEQLIARWPHLVRRNPGRSGPYVQIKLVNPAMTRG